MGSEKECPTETAAKFWRAAGPKEELACLTKALKGPPPCGLSLFYRRPRLKNQETRLFRLKLCRPASKMLGIRKGSFFLVRRNFISKIRRFLFLKQGLAFRKERNVFYDERISADL